jgi:putative ABC transport system substrate-binding protein
VIAFAAAALAGALALAPAAHAQPAKTYRVGVLTVGEPSQLRAALRELGYVEGRNLVLDVRVSSGRPDDLDPLARDLVRSKSDVIVAGYPGAALAAKRATSTVPIVMMNTPDPVQLGLVQSLARPGGNITGTTSLSVDLSVKQLELLKQALPRAKNVAVLTNPDNPWHPLVVNGLRGDALGLRLSMLELRDPSQFEAAFRRLASERVDAMVVLADPMLQAPANRARLVELALTHRLPSIGGLRGWAEAGGMMSYWADDADLNRRVASYVDRILRGAPPSALPVEQPKEYELVVNETTVKALGLALPQALLLRATVIR